MDRLLQDLRFALRLLWKHRNFSITTIATLALCLAANVAIFAVVNGVLLKPLPFDEPDRLVRMFNKYPGAGVDSGGSNGVPDYFDRRRDMTALEEQALFREAGVTISGSGLGEAERIQAMTVTPSFFKVLRMQPYRGQLFTDAQGELGQEKVVILTHGFWQRLFAGRDDAIGQDLRLGGEPYKIVGVLPPGFVFLNPDIQLFRPAAFTAREKSDDSRHSNNWQQFGRLKPGATLEQAQSQLDAINAANFERFPQWREILKNARFGSDVLDFQAQLIGERRSTLGMLWGGAIFVLLIGCVNVANLVLVRSTSRIRELATRHAMGATFGRLARQSLTESTVLSICGGLAGLGLGWWALRAAPFFGFDRLPSGLGLALDSQVVGFTVLLIALVGIGVGLIPVIAMRRANMAQVIREEGRSGTQGRGPRLMRRVLVTSQVAFALILLIGAGVLLASFDRVLTINPGFRADNVLTGTISMPASRYKDEAALRTEQARILERLRALPGVEAAGTTTTLPFSGSYSDSVILAEGYQMAPGESLISPGQVSVSDGYFEAMGAKLIAGRFFNAEDAEGKPRVMIIDERLAQRFWKNGDALGKRMYFPQDINNLMAKPREDQMITIVGIIETMRLRGLVDTQAQKTGTYYGAMRQGPARTLGIAIRTAVSPETLTGSVRREVAQLDPEMPFYGVRTLEDRVTTSLMDRRTPMLLATGFAGVALFLAAIGIYGVLAYQVSQRRREIGIRMALGAESASIFNLVLKEGGLIVGVGAVLGLAGAFLLRQTLQSQLYETGALDPRVVGAVAVMLIVVAMIACVLPARRAAKTDPLIALSDQ
ncbi:MAG: ABC transporter permease [Cyanobacteria bacterium]|nr:ABC transporter permease [Cyanobacteriota bacterium]